ncbi:sigma factor-like helix-turn-helix DNA-binding protein [Cryptosporangium arvum]|uniref:sigma factor-like helix-turn-helix DNA-binding protein n=1 Tax=Cryptosporangium arvum TaxID=80871 RepID=UPI0004BC901D|nr:sigma factor-like helix-turn-helix DNA-binding protein [Cryptosporangium arvum]
MDELDASLLPLLDRLTPHEQVAYVLREAFAWPYQHIGVGLGLPEWTVRQVVRRARARLEDLPWVRPPVTATSVLHAALAEADRTGDPSVLIALAHAS